MIHIVICDVT